MSGNMPARLKTLVDDVRTSLEKVEPEGVRLRQSAATLASLAAAVPLRRAWSDDEPAAPRQ